MNFNGKRKFSDHVDSDYAKRGVWLVKVPRYLSEMWEKNVGHDVGRLVIKTANGKTDLMFKSNTNLLEMNSSGHDKEASSSDSLLSSTSENSLLASRNNRSTSGNSLSASRNNPVKSKQASFTIPDEHSFVIGDIRNQSLAVLCEDKSGLNEDADICSGHLSIEGRVVKRADCRPPQTADYMRMKIKQIEKSSQPKRHVKQMEKAEVKFKPIAVHAEMLAREKQKKEGAKTVRADKNVVRQAIFHAFEKHQYYRLIDLQKLTSQPPGFVKEILTEIAVYNTMPPHKSMWELKPEYRSYRRDKKETE
uniref:General transcription factor IIF subunit 2 n=1 Tax=Onchocerca volvulus TaxID=6282 RepID=A0A8R1XVN3_ONCVO